MQKIRKIPEKHKHCLNYRYSPTYSSWKSMKQRCTNPNRKDYEFYGGRGINICPKWLQFSSFLKDMGERPLGMSLDRIDVNGDYEPKNCKWATQSEQVKNRRKL